MKWIIWVLLVVFPTTSFAESYTLIAETHCSSSGEKLAFVCEAGNAFYGILEFTIFQTNGSWYGREQMIRLADCSQGCQMLLEIIIDVLRLHVIVVFILVIGHWWLLNTQIVNKCKTIYNNIMAD